MIDIWIKQIDTKLYCWITSKIKTFVKIDTIDE